MSSAIAEASSYSTSVVGPDATDKVTAASVRVMGASLANRTKYLNDLARSSGGALAFFFVSKSDLNPATWIGPAPGTGWTQADVTGTIDRIVAPINLPNGCTITSFTVTLTGGGGHSAAPAIKANADLQKYTAGGVFAIANGSDNAVYPTYDATHSFNVSVPSEVVNTLTSAYVVTLSGESGSNSVAGLQAFCVVVHFTPHA